MKKTILLLVFFIAAIQARSAYILIPMDETQKNHLKAYGIAYYGLQKEIEVHWLLNYKGGSFLIADYPLFEKECAIRGVSFQIIADVQKAAILAEIANPEVNMDDVKLEKAPKIAVYSPKNKLPKLPWDDAVILALNYAEIPYDIVYDEEVLSGILPKYDWLHLHHEDFTGQYGHFWYAYRNVAWYQENVRLQEEMAHQLGFKKVSQMKLAVALKIRDFTVGGGFLFAMCSATDSYDCALAAEGIDICESMFDGDGADAAMNSKLDYSKDFAFNGYNLNTNPGEYRLSDIDNGPGSRKVPRTEDFFTLFEFSAKWDPVPTMLCQDHEQVIKGFMGQTTAFKKKYIKSEVLIMGDNKAAGEARYIHGEFGKGTWTFYSGHDPEDYQHQVGDPPTDLALHPNSPGYRLILNNILFPAAKKKKQKT
jgi:hypothetical protein